MNNNLEELCINTIRVLAIDQVQQANSGHPGMPMGTSAVAFILWDKLLKHNPRNPFWPDRDRFILSAGHGSALIYALLHLTGYNLPLEQLKKFRQWESLTPGHPEYGVTPGVEVTTGPLGQGFANGVGMAITEKWLAEKFNRPGYKLIDHHIYVLVSDGDLQEGIAAEAASLAGTLKLGKLIYLYDDNEISIEGSTGLSFTENVGGRFEAYGWNVIGPIDGHKPEEIEDALIKAKKEGDKPSLIICRTIIGYGSPNKSGKSSAHGEPLGEKEVELTKANLGWPYLEPFFIPQEALTHFRKALERGKSYEDVWNAKLSSYRNRYPELAEELNAALGGNLPFQWQSVLSGIFNNNSKAVSTREASGLVLNLLAGKIDNLIGGSADLGPSTKTIINSCGDFGFPDCTGRNIHFGVREHAMAAIANGIARHGGLIPYVSTFLIFSDYMRPAIRLAALMKQRVIFIFSHDSIGVGEDGPTHQPVEQLMSLRLIPNLTVFRPADSHEVTEAWKIALEKNDGPTAIVLSRQTLPLLDRTNLAAASDAVRGGYTLLSNGANPQVILIGTGSEVSIAVDAAKELMQHGIQTNVVSLPSWDLFDSQPMAYKETVLGDKHTPKISIEAGCTTGWQKFTGERGICLGLDHFGASAPAKTLYEKFGLTAQALVKTTIGLVNDLR